jgi:hypothetical protein
VAPDRSRIRNEFPYYGDPYTKDDQVGITPVSRPPKKQRNEVDRNERSLLFVGGGDCVSFDFDEDVGAHKPRDDDQHRRGTIVPQPFGANRWVEGKVLSPHQILRNLHQMLGAHSGPLKERKDVLPSLFRLSFKSLGRKAEGKAGEKHSTFPADMTTGTMNGVPVRSIPAVRVLQRAPQDIHFPRNRDEMDMVGHQTVAHDCQAVGSVQRTAGFALGPVPSWFILLLERKGIG